MEEAIILKIMQNTLICMLLVGGPLLLASMLVGLIISMLQTATAIHEQTLTFVPKIIAVFITLGIFGSFILKILMDYMHELMAIFANIPKGG